MAIGEDQGVIGGGDVSIEGSTHLLGRWITCPSLMRDIIEGKSEGIAHYIDCNCC